MEIIETAAADIPLELLLEADPSVHRIQTYLPLSRCFVALVNGEILGTYVVRRMEERTFELMNIAVRKDHRGRGIGKAMLEHMIETLRVAGAERLEVGTGTFGYQLTLYQKVGFRALSVERDHFLKHYDEPIFEFGMQHKDLLRLGLDL
jgi:ribosomal protein S18 acetylase RimI-like enzyme